MEQRVTSTPTNPIGKLLRAAAIASPQNRPQIKVSLAGMNVSGLLDTGASVSVIQYDLFTRLSARLHRTLLLRPASPLQGVSGESLNVLGSTEIKVDGLSKPVTVRVHI